MNADRCRTTCCPHCEKDEFERCMQVPDGQFSAVAYLERCPLEEPTCADCGLKIEGACLVFGFTVEPDRPMCGEAMRERGIQC